MTTVESAPFQGHVPGIAPNSFYVRHGKRLCDIVIAMAAVTVLWPIMLAASLAVALGDGFPVIFRQARAGMHLRPFVIAKFRTMKLDFESHAGSWKKSDPGSDGATQSAPQQATSDPRIFRGAGLLRRYSIDELPQLWNVLAGDMSIVGPRPLLCRQVDDNFAVMADVLTLRAAVRPGITGLWQVSGRSDVTFERMMKLDSEYVRGVSFTGDLQIIARTILVVLLAAGAA